MSTLNPTAIKRWIALEVRRLREDAGYDRAAAAERIGKASTVIAHIETARNLPAPADIEVLLELYGASDRVPFFRDLIRQAKRGRDWWVTFSDVVPEGFELYLGLESGAARISSVNLNVVPGLFQTRDYTLGILRSLTPRLSDKQVQGRTELRQARQATVLDRDNPPQIWAVLDEAALRRQVGGPAVLRAQLEHLAQLVERPNIDIQVLPFATGSHAATYGGFVIWDYPPEFVGDPGTVFMEFWPRDLYLEKTEELSGFRGMFERLQAQAESPARSQEIFLNIAKELS